MNIKDFQPSAELKILAKGDPGTRKSTAFGDFPGPIYWADWDGKFAVVHKHWGNKRNDIQFDSFRSTVKDYDEFSNKMEQFQKEDQANALSIKTLIIDSYTAFSTALIEYALACQGGIGSKGSVGKIPLLGFEEYGVEARGLTMLVNIGMNLHCNFVLIGHIIKYDKMDVQAGKTVQSRKISVAGNQIGAIIPSKFNEIWHFDASLGSDGKMSYKIFTQHSGSDFARTALSLPETIVNDGGLYERIKPYLNVQKLK